MSHQTNEVDALIITVRPDDLLIGLRTVAAGKEPDDSTASLLERLGLTDSSGLTDTGRAIHKTAWILGEQPDAVAQLSPRLAGLMPIQVLHQELAGYGAVPESGALELLRIHSAVPAGINDTEFRRFLMWANSMGYLKYSTKTKTVRVAVEDSDASDVAAAVAAAGVVSPRTPFSNVVRLRRILRDLRGVVWWIDPYFHRRALEELITNLDFSVVSEVRILSSGKSSVLTAVAKTDFVQFEAEIALKGSAAQWKQDPSRDWHDRWLFGDSGGFNMPPAELIFSGKKYSEFTPAGDRPPLEKWWSRSKAW